MDHQQSANEHVTPAVGDGTISPAHLMQLILQSVAANDRTLHLLRKELKAMSDQSQALLAEVGKIEAANAGLIGLAQALKAQVDAGAGAVAALAATNADVQAANDRLAALTASTTQATTENTPAPPAA